MFNKLDNFSYQRSTKEAIGFYLAYLLLIILVSVGISIPASLFLTGSEAEAYNAGILIGTITAISFSMGTAALFIKNKKLSKNIGLVLLVPLAGILALLAGGVGGLIPAAYLSTRKK